MIDPHAVVSWLAELKQDNKPWFDANQPRFQALRKEFATAIEFKARFVPARRFECAPARPPRQG